MKKITIILAVFLIPFMTSAQKNFNKLAKAYQNEKGVTIVQLDKDLIDLYKRDNLNKEYLDVLSKIKSVNILTSTHDMGSKDNTTTHLKRVNNCFDLNKYKLIKSRIDQKGFAKVYVKKDGENLSELLVINSADRTSFALIMLTGDLKLSNLHKLSYALDIEGLESLSEIGKNNKKQFYASRNNQEKEIKRIKDESNELKKKLKEIKIKSKNFNEKEFEDAMEELGEAMGEWGENFGDNLEKMLEKLGKGLEQISENVVIDDDNYNISLGGDKATIHITPDDDAVCLIDGVKVANTKITDLKEGEINRVRIIKRTMTNEKYLLITTHRKIGKMNYQMATDIKVTRDKSKEVINESSEDIKFTYKGKTYKYNSKDKNFPKFIFNGKKINSLKGKSTSNLIQIRPISKDEKKAFDIKDDRIIIETKL